MKKYFCALLSSVLLLCSCSETDTVSDTIHSEQNNADTQTQTEEEIEDVTITMAVYNAINLSFQKYVDQFNDMDNGYNIVMKDYHEFADDTIDDPVMGSALADMQLNQDIIKGGVIDMVYGSSFFSSGNYEILQNKGAFSDLNSFIENDSEFDRSQLNDHILSLCETDGKLYCMPTFYYLETLLGTKKYVGDRQSWTADELIECYNNAPQNASFNLNHDKVHVYLVLLRANLGSYVDYKNGTTNFNCPEFIKILEFCNRFDDIYGVNSVDYESPLFVKDCFIDSFEHFHNSMWEFCNIYSQGEECSLIGYPSDSENGAYITTSDLAFSICNTSSDKVKQGAWEFIKMIVSEDVQNEILSESSLGFPINNVSFEKYAEDSIGTGENIVSMQGNKVDIGYFSQEEYNMLVDYINNTNCLRTTIYEELNKIIRDEAYAYFSGEQTVEKTAEYIQSRASLMVSEKTG